MEDLEKLTLEVVEERLKEIAKEKSLDLMDEKVLWHYSQIYGGMTNEIADILCPRYGFIGNYPSQKKEEVKTYKNAFPEIRRRAKLQNISEQDMLEDACKNNPQYTRSEMEEFVRRIYHPTDSELDDDNLTVEVMEERLKEIADEMNLDLLDVRVLADYCKRYGGVSDEIADIVFPRYGFVAEQSVIRKMRMKFDGVLNQPIFLCL